MKDKEKKKEADRERVLDLDGFAPDKPGVAKKFIKFGGKKYLVKDFLDVGLGTFFQIMANEEELEGKSQVEQIKLARDNVKLLVPDMPEEMVNNLSIRQVTRIIEMSTGMTESPPVEGSGSDPDSGS